MGRYIEPIGTGTAVSFIDRERVLNPSFRLKAVIERPRHKFWFLVPARNVEYSSKRAVFPESFLTQLHQAGTSILFALFALTLFLYLLAGLT
jgi:hypothetical protein